MPFDKVIAKIERVQFLPHNVVDSDNIFSVCNFSNKFSFKCIVVPRAQYYWSNGQQLGIYPGRLRVGKVLLVYHCSNCRSFFSGPCLFAHRLRLKKLKTPK